MSYIVKTKVSNNRAYAFNAFVIDIFLSFSIPTGVQVLRDY